VKNSGVVVKLPYIYCNTFWNTMKMSIKQTFALCMALTISTAGNGKELDLKVVSRIKDQAFNHSQVMDYVSYLSDVNGARLAGSAQYQQAANWSVETLKKMGLSDAKLENFGVIGRSWAWSSISVTMLTPQKTSLLAVPLAWSAGTQGSITASAVYAPLWPDVNNPDQQDLLKLAQRIESYKHQYKGLLENKVVLLTGERPFDLPSEPEIQRWSDSDLSEMTKAREPLTEDLSVWPRLNYPLDTAKQWQMYEVVPLEIQADYSARHEHLMQRLIDFLKAEGVAAVMQTNTEGNGGVIFAESFGSMDNTTQVAPPAMQVMPEHYNRIVRLLARDIPVSLQVNIDAEFPDQHAQGMNVIANLVGKRKNKEVVMMGAHLDSWHSGTGATDNAAGVAIVMEAMRILKQLDLKLDRSVRIGLWDGEEQGHLGSRAYVKNHYGDPITMRLKNEHDTFSAYFNIDTGSGKTRGILTQANDMVKPILAQAMEPFVEHGISTLVPRNDWGTDHQAFDAVGLPAFDLLQDQLDYWSHTHHSNVDTLDHVVPQDLMVSAAFLATLVYQAAVADELMPREPLPAALPAPLELPEILRD
jgi:carboxypeptidase Q